MEWEGNEDAALDPSLYDRRTRKTIGRMDEERINYDLLLSLLETIATNSSYTEIDGAILIFLPGLAEIQTLYDLCLNHSLFSNSSKFIIFPLHSILSTSNQKIVFDSPPRGIRKIVIATNIAETGITIPDVVFVIDSGKVKENRYDNQKRMSVLEERFVPKASAKQRQGRAGRVRVFLPSRFI